MSGTFKRLFRVAASACFIFLVIPAPAWADDTTTKYDNSIPNASNTTSTNGRIPIGSSSGDDSGAIGPAVIKDGSTYKMWYCGSDGNWRIYYATSTDGLTWSKSNNVAEANSDTNGTEGRIPLGSTGGDTKYILYPTVIKDDSTYKMWYSGYCSSDSKYRIYYATSSDGLTWTKYNNDVPDPSDTTGTDGRIPLGSNGGDTGHVFSPSVIKDGSTYKMWYVGHDGNYRIYYATSLDGLTWTKSNNVAEANSDTTGTDGRIPLGDSGGDTSQARNPSVIKDGPTYRMWYTGYDGTNYRVYHATSPDGLTWSKVDNTVPGNTNMTTTNGRIALGTADTGDDKNVISCSVIRDGVFKIWYGGNDGSNWRIYYAFQEAPGPIISNTPATNITATNASLIGNLTSTGAAPTEVYCYWGQTNGYTTKGDWANKDYLGTNDVGLLTNSVSDLAAGTLYYYRFYATNSVADAWADSSELFSTLGPPTVNNNGGATNVTATTATLRGEVIGGNPTPTAYIYWGPSDQGTNKTAWSNEVNIGAQLGAFSTNISGLLAIQTNYYRCFATNSDDGAWAPATTNFITDAPSLSISDAEVTEGDGSTTNAVFMITLSATSVVDVTVNFVASNGTAVVDTDFYETNGTLTIVAGVVSNTITVKVKGDTVDEYPSENFYVNLSDPTNATISDSEGVGTITDDDDEWEVKIWTGTGNWTSYTNWTPEGMPSASDDAIIASGTVTLSNSATIASIIVSNGATMTFKNWNTALNAANVTIQSGGKLQHKACDTNAAPSNTNRVYVVCSNMMIEAGGSINVNYLGYQGGPGATTWGQGPGAGYRDGGAGHGGVGGTPSYGTPGGTYGSSNEPVQPGSGGGGYQDARPGMDGGGVVRIDASGRVTVNGTITANGKYNINDHGGSGSGGSIYITCHTFASTNGVIQAYGGYSRAVSVNGGSGGGGRIAVIYDTAAQSALNLTDKPSVVFKVGQGTGYSFGEPGTLYLTDAGFYPTTLLHGGELVIPGFSSWAPESLTITNGQTVFPSGFQLTVNNNLTVTGNGSGIKFTDSKVTVGSDFTIDSDRSYGGRSYLSGGPNSESVVSGDLVVNNGQLSFSSVSTNINTFLIGGDIIVTNGGRFYVTAGLTNASTPDYSALVSVTNDVYIGYSSWIYPTSNNTNGGSPLFHMRNLTIVTNGGFSADSKGFRGGPENETWGYGPGAGYRDGGAGYGGVGGTPQYGTAGGTYGSSNVPIDPGSGGGGRNYPPGMYGGGLVRIEVKRKVTVNGTITASGQTTGSNGRGAGSGGGIYIRCRTFAGESTGLLRAKGGNAPDTTADPGSGGGGRIAVWRTYHTYEGTTSVTNGTAASGRTGQPGTIFWGYIPPKGTFIHIR